MEVSCVAHIPWMCSLFITAPTIFLSFLKGSLIWHLIVEISFCKQFHNNETVRSPRVRQFVRSDAAHSSTLASWYFPEISIATPPIIKVIILSCRVLNEFPRGRTSYAINVDRFHSYNNLISSGTVLVCGTCVVRCSIKNVPQIQK